jgi:hypothetical protein
VAHSATTTQTLARLRWNTQVDLMPQYSPGGALLIHHGSPVLSTRNTVLVPVKTAAMGASRVEAHAGASGALLWSADSDYILPPHNWTPSYNTALDAGGRIYFPGAGGKLFFRDGVDSAAGTVQMQAFYGTTQYLLHKDAFDAAVYVNTPITVDAQGNVYFGYTVLASTPLGLASGIARLAANDLQGSSVTAANAASDQRGALRDRAVIRNLESAFRPTAAVNANGFYGRTLTGTRSRERGTPGASAAWFVSR